MLNYSLYSSSRLNASTGAARTFAHGPSAKTLPARQLQTSPDIRRVGSRGDRHGFRIVEAIRPQAEPLGSILCVGHEQESVAPIAQTLGELGYAVDVAPDGEVGLAKIIANRPDLILCNFSASRGDGLELL